MSERKTSDELDKALKHLLNRAEPSPEPEAAPASEAKAPEVPNAELAQLRARVAILDAQEVELPPMDYGLAAQEQCDERERQLLDALRAVQAWREVARKQNEALKFLAQEADGEISPATFEFANSAAAAYDALAGKDGE